MKKFTIGWLYFIFCLLMSFLVGSDARLTSHAASPQQSAGDPTVYLPSVINGLRPIVPESTTVLGSETLDQLQSISSDGATFRFAQSTNELAQVDAGDVIVGGVSPNTPEGFLRKVVDVQQQNGAIVVTTVPASLEDAIQQGSLSISRSFSPSDVQVSSTLPGVELLLSSPANVAIEDSFFYQLNDVVLYDDDGNLSTTYDQIKASGSFEFKPDFDLNMTYQNWTLEELEFIFNVEEKVELEFAAEVDVYGIEESYQIAQLHLGTFTAFIGPVPVVITVKMPIYLKVDGDLTVGITTSVAQEAELSAGLRYQNDSWQPVSDLSNKFTFKPPTPFVGVKMKGYIDPPLQLFLYGAVGPFASAIPYLKFEANSNKTPWWELHAGIEATAGVELKVFKRTLAKHVERVIGYEILLAHASTGANRPPNVPSNPDPPSHSNVRPGPVVLSWTGGDPDGDQVSYDLYVAIIGCNVACQVEPPPGAFTLEAAGLTDSTYSGWSIPLDWMGYWKVVAKDSKGLETNGPVWRAYGYPCLDPNFPC